MLKNRKECGKDTALNFINTPRRQKITSQVVHYIQFHVMQCNLMYSTVQYSTVRTFHFLGDPGEPSPGHHSGDSGDAGLVPPNACIKYIINMYKCASVNMYIYE